MDNYGLREFWAAQEQSMKGLARRRRTMRHLQVTAAWWPTNTDGVFSGTYCLLSQQEAGDTVQVDRVGCWPEACDDLVCHMMTGMILACDHLLSFGHGPGGTPEHPTETQALVEWPHLLTGLPAAEWRLEACVPDSAGYGSVRSAGASITEFDRYGADLPQIEVLRYRLDQVTRQMLPELIGTAEQRLAPGLWSLASQLNTGLSAYTDLNGLMPAHAEMTALMLMDAAPPPE